MTVRLKHDGLRRSTVASAVPGLAAVALGLASDDVLADPRDAARMEPAKRGVEADDLRLDTVVVTARKRDELVQRVPLTISVLTRKLLERAQVRDGFDLAALTPGFTYESVGSFANAKPVIRGLTTASTVPSQQKSSSFIDGLFVGGTTSPPPFIDLQRVEVLKGPQSAALGRATFAGAVNYITREPSHEPTGELRVSGASHGDNELGVSLGAPLTSAIRARVTGFARDTGGDPDWTNADGVRMGWERVRYGAVRIFADVAESSQLKARYSYLQAENGPVAAQFIDPSQRNTRFVRSEDTVSADNTPKSPSFTFFPTGPIDASLLPRNQDFSLVGRAGTDVTKKTANLELNTSLGRHTLTILAGTHRDETFDWQTDGSNLRCWLAVPSGQPPRGEAVCGAASQSYRAHEAQVRLTSPDHGPVQYLVGASYLEYTSSWFGYQPLTGSTFFSVPTDDVQSRSAYAALSAELRHQFRFGLEGRYTSDDLVTTGHAVCIFPATSLVPSMPCEVPVRGVPTAIGNPFTGAPLDGAEVLRGRFAKFTYRVTADRQWGDRAMLYAIYSLGNQPGRFNAGLPAAFDHIRSLQEEELRNAEIGLKSQWRDGRLLFNAALYRMNWTNQVFRRTVSLDNSGGVSILQAALINGGDSRITGVEIEAGARPTRELELRATLAYAHAVFTNYCSEFYYQLTGVDTSPDGRGRCRDVDGNYLEAQPKWTGSIAADYERGLGIGDWNWYTRADYAYLGRKFDSEMNLAWVPAARTADLRIGLSSPRWRIEAFALNLTDDRTPGRIARLTDPALPTTSPGSTPAGPRIPGVSNRQSLLVIPRPSRQFGLRIQYRFGSLRD